MTDGAGDLGYVAEGEVTTDMTERQVRRLREELNDLRRKVAEWRCDECGERSSTCTKGADGPALCNECAGLGT